MTRGRYLFGIDLEDPRFMVPGGERLPPRVPELTERYLEFLRARDARATFFIVGDVARAYPGLVRDLAREGHEIACHSDAHVPITSQSKAAFREDVLRGLDALAAAGADRVRGYRAPSFSLTPATPWAHDVLSDLGFLYSSSVLPARSPHFGWPGFGEAPRLVSGVVEMPMTLVHARLMPLPLGGGVYFRTLPKAVLRRAFAARRGKAPVTGYFHPADIDAEAAPVRYPGVGRAGNWLLHRGRAGVLSRLEMVAALGFSFEPYAPEAERLKSRLTQGASLA